MNKFTAMVIALLSMSYTPSYTQLNTNIESVTHEKPYDLTLQLEKMKGNNYNLIIKMDLKKDAHYVSPNSKGNFSGQFTMFIDNNTNFTSKGKFSESPLSKESFDPWGNGKVNFVKENTTHTQQLTITDENDFEVSGWIQFVIEPRCTMEKIKFTITKRSGKVEIKKVNTKK